MLAKPGFIPSLFVGFLFTSMAVAAPPSRITRRVDPSRTALVPGRIHRLAQAQFDRGEVDPAQPINYIVLLVKPSSAQQAGLDALLLNQQNPSSPSFRSWLTPDQFGSRFGLNSSDQSKIVSWLTAQGFSIEHSARSANWIAFSGSAAKVSAALHIPIHRFQVNGEMHFANTAQPSVPEALSGVVAGFLGLNDFKAHSDVKVAQPEYTTGSTHYLAPADFSTIYDVAPLYAAGINGTGQSIAIVGESDILLSDITAFRTRYGLPANSPKLVPYGSTDPGYTGAQLEADLDLEWSGAIAPNATIYYVYGASAFTAIIAAVELNVAPIISASYGDCEINEDYPGYEAVAQQANAQGITILASSGDSGAAGCDGQGAEPFATRGRAVNFPASLPEVTGVGGTEFNEGTGNYWNPTNTTLFGSAISYIPEAAWNENASSGLFSTGGGVSIMYPKPLWQAGPGVPPGGMRDVPDIAFSSAGHDAYEVYSAGSNVAVYGTSCAAPSMAGIVALLNHYQIANKFQKTAGLGNINPQIYRLAQIAPSAFHDVLTGNNIVQCAQGSPDCSSGSFGYTAGVAYDLTTGLGSLDVNNLATQWNTAADATLVTLSASATKATLNDTIQLTATVAAASGTGNPTGTVSFNYYTLPLGTVPLTNGSATVSVPLYQFGGTGTATVSAQYSGDASFSPGSATKSIQITAPSGVTSIVLSGSSNVYPQPADAQGLSWQTTITLSEVAGVPANVAGLTIDGVAQSLTQYFPEPQIAPKGSVTASFIFRGLAAPVTKTFVFTGTDPTGLVWTRQMAIVFAALPTYDYFNLTATPLTAVQNPANTACPWSVQLNVDDLGGFGVNLITDLEAGGLDYATQITQIFGTRRLDAYGGLQGTLCFSGITPPATDAIYVALGDGANYNLNVNFAAQPANPGTLSVTPAGLNLTGAATLAVNLSDKTQQWTANIYPANRTTSWLTASQLSGTGSGTITLTANGAGFEPGAYRATIVLQSQNAVPQYINVPVMFVLGGTAAATTITAVANAASFKTQISPGMLMSIFGTGLANSTATNSGNPLPYSLAGVSVTVNGLAAPVIYASPGLLNVQVPYSAGAGPAVLGVNNNGTIAAFSFTISPSSPGVFADANGNVVPIPTVKAGMALALYVTGTGDVNPALKTAYSPSSGSTTPAPLLPLSVTVGGLPAFLEFVGITPGLIGVTQVNILVPSATPLGNQPVIVTVNGAASAPVNVVVQ